MSFVITQCVVVLSNAHDFVVDGAEVFTIRPSAALRVSRIDRDFFYSSVKPLVTFIFKLPFTEIMYYE